jgi:sugar phosphate isomerase/epimerase
VQVVMSNLAWEVAEDPGVAAILADAGVSGIEVAPTKVWPDLSTVSADDAERYRRSWEQRGLPIVSMQSLLFGRPDLVLFGEAEVTRNLVSYLRSVIDLAAALGARPLVFGSPRNRRREGLALDEAERRAADVFGELADYATTRGTCLCIEPNPTDYGADFVNHAAQGASLVRRVSSAGFGLHLDTGCLTLVGDDVVDAIADTVDVLRHFHCSEPGLAPIGRTGRVDHQAAGTALRRAGYTGYVSVEMLIPDGHDRLADIADAAALAVAAYG